MRRLAVQSRPWHTVDLLSLCLLRFLVLVCAAEIPNPGGLQPAFRIVSFTPTNASALKGRQALTVVFTLPVAPLGEDVTNKPLTDEMVPFTIQGASVPGRLFWVSTNTANFKPLIDWPSDLQTIKVTINPKLRSVNGEHVRDAPCYTFSTEPLQFWVESVSSQKLQSSDDQQYSNQDTANSTHRIVYECPEDADVKVRFSNDVSWPRLYNEPGIFEVADSVNSIRSIKRIATCQDAKPEMLNLAGSSTMEIYATRCVHLYLTGIEPLMTGSLYTLRIRHGAQCHPLAGPYEGTINGVQLTGPRPSVFKFLEAASWNLHQRHRTLQRRLRDELTSTTPQPSLQHPNKVSDGSAVVEANARRHAPPEHEEPHGVPHAPVVMALILVTCLFLCGSCVKPKLRPYKGPCCQTRMCHVENGLSRDGLMVELTEDPLRSVKFIHEDAVSLDLDRSSSPAE